MKDDYLAGMDPNDLLKKIQKLEARVRSLELKKVKFNRVDEVTNDLGVQEAGEFRAGNGVEPGSGFTGVRMTTDGVNGYDNDVLQAGLSATDGKITAGAGAVKLTGNGISILGDAANETGALTYKNSSGTKIAELRSYDDTEMGLGELSAKVFSRTGKDSGIDLYAACPSGKTAVVNLSAVSGSNQSILNLISNGSLYGPTLSASFDNLTLKTKSNLGDTGVITGGAETIADDDVFSFTPATSRGVLILRGPGSDSTIYAMLTYAAIAGTAYTIAWVNGSNTVITTGTLAGTTGTDGKLTISAHTDGKIYIENRRGGSRALAWQIMAGA